MGTSLFLIFLAGNVCSLQSLGLGGNDIHDEGAIHLAQALKTNTRLCSLGLGGNQIGRNIMLLSLYYENLFEMLLFIADEGGKAIADMLRLNQTLRKLLLSSNLLGELTCSNNYCDKVPTAPSLPSFPSGDGAVEYLADALQVNSGLEMLLLADNPFGDEGGQHLAEVLCNSNRSLKVLDVHDTRMTRAGEKEVGRQGGV